MPAFDQCHEQVVHALQKDGWRVADQQVRLTTGRRNAFIDMRIAHGFNGNGRTILLVEVKCFPPDSDRNSELYGAIGQYLIYRAMLVENDDDTALYLSIPTIEFAKLTDRAFKRVIAESNIKLLIVDLEQERIIEWIE